MNWIDLTVIAIIALGAIIGLRAGLIGAAVTAIGALAGWTLAGQYSDEIGRQIGPMLGSTKSVYIASYILIMAAALVVSGLIGDVVRRLLSTVTFRISSVIDRVGGLALGLAFGILFSGVFISADAGFVGKKGIDDAHLDILGNLETSSLVPLITPTNNSSQIFSRISAFLESHSHIDYGHG